ncbi:MAG: HAD family hydrolase [Prevotella sp.]
MFTEEKKEYMEKHGFATFNPKAVLFDMDGVLYDSMPNHAISWHKSMKTFNIDMKPEDAYRYEGMRGVETIRLLARQQWGRELSWEEAQRMYDKKSEVFSSCPPAKVMEGVRSLQEQIKADGLKIVVVTGSGQRSLLDKLATDFEGLVSPELIVSSFDVTQGKPHPEPYLKGLQKAGVNPWEAIVVENAPLGVRAAVAARIFTVAVNTGPLPDRLLTEEGASVVFPNMDEFGKNWKMISASVF